MTMPNDLLPLTQMPTVNGGGVAQVTAVEGRDLMEIAEAINHIAAEIAAGAAPAPNSLAAIERIQDIAFVLHERPVEATLCDALDAALREIVDAGENSDSTAERLRNATALLRGLENRVREMIARALAARDVEARVVAQSPVWPLEGAAEETGDVTEPVFDWVSRSVDIKHKSLVAATDASPSELSSTEKIANDEMRSLAPPVDDVAVQSSPLGGVVGSLPDGATLHSTLPTPEPVTGPKEQPEGSFEQPAPVPSLFQPEPHQQAIDHGTPGDEDGIPKGGHLRPPYPPPVPAPSFTENRVEIPTGSSASSAVVAEQAPDAAAASARSIAGMEPPPQTIAASISPQVFGASSASAAVSRPIANDPLVALQALDEEELIALFS